MNEHQCTKSMTLTTIMGQKKKIVIATSTDRYTTLKILAKEHVFLPTKTETYILAKFEKSYQTTKSLVGILKLKNNLQKEFLLTKLLVKVDQTSVIVRLLNLCGQEQNLKKSTVIETYKFVKSVMNCMKEQRSSIMKDHE